LSAWRRIFEHPSDGWQTADEYLSGLVIDKLEEAQAAAAMIPSTSATSKRC
jgi:N12 class adenine-specific DNA methylase